MAGPDLDAVIRKLAKAQNKSLLAAAKAGRARYLALAGKAKKLAQKHGLDAKVFDMADADLALLSKAKNIVVYAATWGEGDPPSRAVDFYQALMSDAAPRIDGVRFAVLALGDTAYTQFCATGKAIDARLEELGGVRVADRSDLDLDYAKQAADWTEKSLAKFAPPDAAAGGTVVHVDFGGAIAAGGDDDEPRYTAENPLEAEISALVNLNGTGSSRETWHAEFAFEDPAFNYQPGDAAVITDLPWGRLGMTICYDVRFPALYRALAESGASFLAVPSAFTKKTGEAHWHTLLRARAIENGCYVFAAAQGGVHENKRETYGHSLIVDPWGTVIADSGNEEPGVVIATIDPAQVAKVRKNIPSLLHGRRFSIHDPKISGSDRLHLVRGSA